MTEKTIPIPARLRSSVVDGHVAGTEDIIDDRLGKTQSEVNEESAGDISALRQDVDTINSKIPSEASSSNKLTDKSYVDTKVSDEESRAKAAEQANQNAISSEASRAAASEQAISSALAQETLRAQNAEQALQNSISTESQRASSAEDSLRSDLVSETTRATAAEASLQSAVSVESSRAASAENTLAENLSSEETRAKAAERQNSDAIAAVSAKIPSQASETNQLADKEFVNSTVATQTSEFKGTYNSLEALEAVTADNNDYGFVISQDSVGNTVYNRYKYNGSVWMFEYALNNSSFTSSQWAAINSLLTEAHKTKLDALPTASELAALFEGKQDVISDLETIRSNAAAGATAYQKPQNGIPSTDMTSEVQTSLSKADTAYQKSSAGIPASDLSQNVQDSLGLADSAYQLPSNGIPKTQLASDVQASLGKADTALQEHQSLSDYYTKSETDDLLSDKQDTLESGTNIKTINNQSLLGEGNITIEGGSTVTPGNGIDITDGVVSVKAGENISFDGEGNIKAKDTTYDVFQPAGEDASSGLVPAPRTTPGSSRYLCEDGTWKTPAGGGGGYELPVASATELGGIKIGSGLSINGNGVLSADETILKNVYIGTGETYQDVMVPANFYQTVRKGEAMSITSSQNYLFIVISPAYSALAMMEGIIIPMTASTIDVSGVVYKVYKSNLAYSGSYNLILF